MRPSMRLVANRIDLNDMSGSQFKSALEDIHNKIQIPIYITEYDIGKDDDNVQATRYKEQFPIMWRPTM